MPTESSYGIAADIRKPVALDRLIALKTHRPDSSPFALIAADLASARQLARVWPVPAADLAARYWPGPLTLVVPARDDLPACLVGPDGGVGVRVPGHSIARALAATLGAVITATSANRSGQPPATTVADARAALQGDIAVYLDGGTCNGTPSTVASIAEDGSIRILRPGAVELSP